MIIRSVFNKSIIFILFSFLLVACGSNDPAHRPSQTDETGSAEDAQASPGSVVRILPLGDSITQGGSGYASYRRDLWFLLKSAAYKVDFVGSQRGFHGEVEDNLKDFDLEHEGHWAWEAGEIEANLSNWLKNYQADIVLLHAGTNDFDRGQSNESTMQELASIIDKLRINNPDVIILIAKIIPMKHKDTRTINESIAALAESKNTQKSPLVVVDQYEGYHPLEDNHDNFHPNTQGEHKIASKWFEALKPYLKK